MDADILEELYRRYYKEALLYATALCGDHSTAEDLVADAFVKAYISLPNEVSTFRFWLLRVCKNLWIDQLRKQRHLVREELLEALADTQTPELHYIENERHRALWRAIASLPREDRELLTLHYFSGVPLQEIALLLKKGYPAVRKRISRLRQILKQKMEEQGYEY